MFLVVIRMLGESHLVEFMYLVFTRVPGESYRWRLGSLLLRFVTSFECLLTLLRVDSAHENVDNKLSVCQRLSVMRTKTSLTPQRHCLWDVQTAETSALVRCTDRDATACMMCRQ